MKEEKLKTILIILSLALLVVLMFGGGIMLSMNIMNDSNNKQVITENNIIPKTTEKPQINDPEKDNYVNIVNAKKELTKQGYDDFSDYTDRTIIELAYGSSMAFSWSDMDKYTKEPNNPEYPQKDVGSTIETWYGYFIKKEYTKIIQDMDKLLKSYNFTSVHQNEMTSLYHDALILNNIDINNDIELIESIKTLKNSKALIMTVTTYPFNITKRAIKGYRDDIEVFDRIKFKDLTIIDDMSNEEFKELQKLDGLAYKFEIWEIQEIDRQEDFRVIIGVRLDGTKEIVSFIKDES